MQTIVGIGETLKITDADGNSLAKIKILGVTKVGLVKLEFDSVASDVEIEDDDWDLDAPIELANVNRIAQFFN